MKIEYTTSEAVNEARQRHIAAVMDVFDVYLGMDNVAMFASATVDCVLCLLKYVHGPGTHSNLQQIILFVLEICVSISNLEAVVA